MKIKPILFGTPMVQAILEGRKTQTRRIVKDKLLQENKNEYSEEDFLLLTVKKLINKGDILWVRETWQKSYHLIQSSIDQTETSEDFVFKADNPPTSLMLEEKWKPSIFMPKAACRIFLEVTNVRVERLQDISEADAKAEGIKMLGLNGNQKKIFKNYMDKSSFESAFVNPYDSFISLWHSINGIESWIANPWVWIYDFKRTEKPADFL